MSMSDPIADFLTRVRNAVRAGHPTVDIPSSTLKAEICRVLKEEGFIQDYVVEDEPKPGLLRVALKYTADREPVLHSLRRVSKPSLRIYRGGADMKLVRSGIGMAIVTTPNGVMTSKRARQQKVGGEIICEVW
jgi:small subunit ribosomal protein S8